MPGLRARAVIAMTTTTTPEKTARVKRKDCCCDCCLLGNTPTRTTATPEPFGKNVTGSINNDQSVVTLPGPGGRMRSRLRWLWRNTSLGSFRGYWVLGPVPEFRWKFFVNSELVNRHLVMATRASGYVVVGVGQFVTGNMTQSYLWERSGGTHDYIENRDGTHRWKLLANTVKLEKLLARIVESVRARGSSAKGFGVRIPVKIPFFYCYASISLLFSSLELLIVLLHVKNSNELAKEVYCDHHECQYDYNWEGFVDSLDILK